MTADYNRTDDFLEHICTWTSYYMHHSDKDTPQCVQVDVISSFFSHWMFYYTHHSNIDALQCVLEDVISSYFPE